MVMGCGHLSLVWMGQSVFVPYIFYLATGIPRQLARSLGKDATLNDVLQILDEHYSIVMTFDALNKELYSLKQG